jgi:hypothetical protein
MRIINCLIAILLAQLCMAQQVKRKVKTAPNGIREVYNVLASDDSTLHGRYLRTERDSRTEGFYKNGFQDGVWTVWSTTSRGKFIRVQGPFKDGKRHGLWTVYATRKKLKAKGYYQHDQRIGFWRFYNDLGELEEEGHYNKDLRTGKWSFYDEKGNLVQEFDYTAKNVISDVSLAALQQRPFKVINGIDTATSILQRPPVYIGGRSKLNRPKIIQYQIKTDSVKVEISFTIDRTGRARNHQIVKSMGYPFDQEAIYTMNQLTSTWLPAMLNGKPVEVQHSVVVLFNKVNMKMEPATYYRHQLRYANIANPWDAIPRGYRLPFMYQAPALSYHACKVQIL